MENDYYAADLYFKANNPPKCDSDGFWNRLTSHPSNVVNLSQNYDDIKFYCFKHNPHPTMSTFELKESHF